MIYELLGTGANNATPATDLARIIGSTRRGVSSLVEQERRAGFPICATTDSKTPGYFIPENRQEMERFCDSLAHRAKEIAKTRSACRKTIPGLPDDGGI